MADDKGSGCAVIIVILLIVAGIMTCTNKCKASSAVSDYKKGNYTDALSTFEKSDESDMNSIELYYYSKLCAKTDSSKERNLKIKAYNKLVNSDSESKKFKNEFGTTEYDSLIKFGEEIALQQKMVKQVESISSNSNSAILGKWKYYRTVDMNGNRLDESKISPKSPTSFYVYEDGTADFNGYTTNGSSSTQKYTWKNENGTYVFYSSKTGKKAGSLNGKYLIIEQGLFYNGSVKYCGIGFVR